MPDTPEIMAVCVGEGLVVFVPDAPGPLERARVFSRSLAGAELNAAIALASAGIGASVITRVGVDGFGTFLVEELARHGVDTSAIERDQDAQTGLYVKEVTANDGALTSRMHYYRQGSAGSKLSPATFEVPEAQRLLASARIVHTTGVTSALSADALAAQHALFADAHEGRIRSFSSHWRPALWRGRTGEGRAALSALIRLSDVAFISAEDGIDVFGTSKASELRALFPEPRYLVVTRADGATAFDGAEHADAPSLDLAVVEPIGATDAFVAGFLAGIANGLSLPGSLARAHRLATRAATSTRDHLVE